MVTTLVLIILVLIYSLNLHKYLFQYYLNPIMHRSLMTANFGFQCSFDFYRKLGLGSTLYLV